MRQAGLYTERKNNTLSYTALYLFIISVNHSDRTLFDTSTHWESVEGALSYFEVMIAVFYVDIFWKVRSGGH